MKFLTSQIMATLRQKPMRRNLAALGKYVAVLAVFVVVFSVLFHVLMVYEGQRHSWLTGLYWTLTVMSTLGFGDITFHSDLGRAFSLLVLSSGIVLLLIVLPFAFIRYFYAPWLEAQIRIKAPRELEEDTSGHVIFVQWDALAEGVIARLRTLGVPYVVLEPDPARAAALVTDDVSTMLGELDAPTTYTVSRASAARLVVANTNDANNTNVALTVREQAPDVPIIAIADDKDAVDILELAGATHVVAVKHRLGEQLAARVSVGNPGAHVIGRFHGLLIAELPVHDTDFVGQTIRETRLRELTGLSVVGYWERGHLRPALPEAVLTEYAVAVVAGTAEQVESLNDMFRGATPNPHPVLVIGGGKVGRAVIRSLVERGVDVHALEREPTLRPQLEEIASRVIIGDGAELRVIQEAGIEQAPSVVLTTHDDAVNIYLALYCRKLNPDCRIVSRIMHDRNLEAIHRAGADFVLGETALGVRTIMSILQQRELVVVSEEVDVFFVPVPPSLDQHTLAESAIGRKTGLNVIGIQKGDQVTNSLSATTRLSKGESLIVLGTNEQRQTFAREFEA